MCLVRKSQPNGGPEPVPPQRRAKVPLQGLDARIYPIGAKHGLDVCIL